MMMTCSNTRKELPSFILSQLYLSLLLRYNNQSCREFDLLLLACTVRRGYRYRILVDKDRKFHFYETQEVDANIEDETLYFWGNSLGEQDLSLPPEFIQFDKVPLILWARYWKCNILQAGNFWYSTILYTYGW